MPSKYHKEGAMTAKVRPIPDGYHLGTCGISRPTRKTSQRRRYNGAPPLSSLDVTRQESCVMPRRRVVFTPTGRRGHIG
jgi:hypothetical protein